jgi:hypothetical protein
MSDLKLLLAALLAAVILIAATVALRYLFRRRGLRLARSGARLRCHYLPDGRNLPQTDLRKLPWFSGIAPARLANLLHRRDIDVATYICDWRTRGVQTVALLHFDGGAFQDFAIYPQTQPGDSGFAAPGALPGLDARYLLRFRDPAQAATEQFPADLLRMLARQDRPLSIGAAGRWMMIYRQNTTVQPDALSVFLGEVHSIAGMMKRSLQPLPEGRGSLKSDGVQS